MSESRGPNKVEELSLTEQQSSCSPLLTSTAHAKKADMDAEEKKEHHSKLLYAYKEFVCQTLDPFFDSH